MSDQSNRNKSSEVETEARATQLAGWLRQYIGGDMKKADFYALNLARCFVWTPQTLMDALVEAGVLEGNGSPVTCGCVDNVGWHYKIVQPHKHEWRVGTTGVESRQPVVELWCDGCREHRKAANRLPIEVPSE